MVTAADAAPTFERLRKITGVDLFAMYPRDVIETQMDRPPREPDGQVKKGWRSIFAETTRIYHTYLRYSFCYPIFMEYAVRTVGALLISVEQARLVGRRLGSHRGEDTLILDERGQPMPLRQSDVARLLGMRRENVHSACRRLEADRSVRFEGLPFDPSHRAAYVNPKPFLTQEDREQVLSASRSKTSLIQADIDSLLRQLGDSSLQLSYGTRVKAIQADHRNALQVIRHKHIKDLDVVRRELRILIEKDTNISDLLLNNVGQSVERPADRPNLFLAPTTSQVVSATPENVRELLQRRLGEKTHDTPRPKLCRDVVAKLKGASLSDLDHRITLRFEAIWSMGMVLNLAQDVRDAYIEREKLRIEDERAYHEQMDHQHREQLMELQARWPSMSPEDREWYSKEMPDRLVEAGLLDSTKDGCP